MLEMVDRCIIMNNKKHHFNIQMCLGSFRSTREIYDKCKDEVSNIKCSCSFDNTYKDIVLNLIDNTIHQFASNHDEIKAVIDVAIEFFPQYTHLYAKHVEKWDVVLTSIKCSLNEF